MLKQGSPFSFGNAAVILRITVLCESIVCNLQSKTKIQFLSSPTYTFILLKDCDSKNWQWDFEAFKSKLKSRPAAWSHG